MHQKILDELIAAQVSYKEIRHDSFATPILSPLDFATALNTNLERITKTVFLRAKTREKHLMAICSCNKKLNLAKLAELVLVNKLEVADREELAEMTGYPPNGVCAIAIPKNISVFLDEDLLNFESVLCGAGEVAIELELAPKDLVTVTNAVVARLTS